jgi:mono/diheme cytochrome c family protein
MQSSGHARLGEAIAALLLASFAAFLSARGAAAETKPAVAWHGPVAIAADPMREVIYLACARSQSLVTVDLAAGRVVRETSLGALPSGLALGGRAARLLVTCSEPAGHILVFDPQSGRRLARYAAGHGVCAPVISEHRQRLFVCGRFENAVGVVDLRTGRRIARIGTVREPVAAALTPDQRWLVVANHLPAGPANATVVAATVTLIDAESLTVRTNLLLPNGSTSLRGVCVSPDGRWACLTHNLARFQVPTTQVEHGWMNDAALSFIDLRDLRLTATLLLDEPTRGAANPWGMAWSADGHTIWVTLSGTHELLRLDATQLLERIQHLRESGLVDDLSFLNGVRQRIPLGGQGPRAVALIGEHACVPAFFADTFSLVDVARAGVSANVPLNRGLRSDPRREGERLFHDATISHQGWQSCASCHPDARADGLNWDLQNDGLGNPKNTKSLVLSHRTPPAMTSGVRESAEKAVRSGMRHILFAVRPETELTAIDTYLKSLRPLPSPFLANGRLSAAARRGKRLFEAPAIGCTDCHAGPLFTDLRSYDVATANERDHKDEAFDTPTLIECWRSAPYLHDGSAASIRDVLTTRNPVDRHGHTSKLSPGQIDDLAAYVLSL